MTARLVQLTVDGLTLAGQHPHPRRQPTQPAGTRRATPRLRGDDVVPVGALSCVSGPMAHEIGDTINPDAVAAHNRHRRPQNWQIAGDASAQYDAGRGVAC
jgi:hypothetical protein